MLQLNTDLQLAPASVGPPLTGPAQVTAMAAGYYLVQYPAPFRPRNHMVTKDKRCACPSAKACPAVEAVTDYLRHGGERAPDPRPGHLIPQACPICGGQVRFEPRLCSPMRGAGWVCLSAARAETTVWPAPYWYPGESHYWQHMWAELGRLRFGRQA